MFPNERFAVRYAILNPTEIVNYCGPRDNHYVQRLNEKSGFYMRLEASIRREGIRNPILVTAGHAGCPNIKPYRLPAEWREHLDHIVICDRNGGSRLYVARNLGMPIPCVISDFIGRFDYCEELFSIPEILAKYQDQPENLRITQHGVHVRNLPQVHLGQA